MATDQSEIQRLVEQKGQDDAQENDSGPDGETFAQTADRSLVSNDSGRENQMNRFGRNRFEDGHLFRVQVEQLALEESVDKLCEKKEF